MCTPTFPTPPHLSPSRLPYSSPSHFIATCRMLSLSCHPLTHPPSLFIFPNIHPPSSIFPISTHSGTLIHHSCSLSPPILSIHHAHTVTRTHPHHSSLLRSRYIHSLLQKIPLSHPSEAGIIRTLSLLTPTISTGQRGGQSGSNECSCRFVVSRGRVKTATRVIKPLLEMATSPTKT